MQAPVLLKCTIGFVVEKSTRMMAFTIILHWSFQAARNGCQSKIVLQKNMVFKLIIVTNIISIFSYRYVCKSDQEVAHSENHPSALLTAASPKTKKSIAGFRGACATKRKSTEGKSSCAFAKKQKI